MDRLFQEGAGGRRRFLDRLVLALEPGHAMHAARYEAAMRARNKLLAEHGAADDGLAVGARGADGRAWRRRSPRRARPTVAALASGWPMRPKGRSPAPGFALEGGERAISPPTLRAGRGRDAAAGRTLVGPHRTDLLVTHLGKNQPAERCSTGEQKALLLAIVLAHADLVAERTARPADAAARRGRRPSRSAFAALPCSSASEAGGGQVWMTGTEARAFRRDRRRRAGFRSLTEHRGSLSGSKLHRESRALESGAISLGFWPPSLYDHHGINPQ